MTTVQPIVYTADPQWWRDFARAVGLSRSGAEDPVWTEWDGDGILAVHGCKADDPSAGTTELHVLVDVLATAREALVSLGVDTDIQTLADVGDILLVRLPSGIAMSAASSPRTTGGGALAVIPIAYGPDPAEVTAAFEAVGLSRRVWSDSGNWTDFTASGGGLAAIHRSADAGVSLSFEYRGDVEAFAADLRSGGYDARVVDEAYNRTVLIATPDRGDVWVNGVIDDTYGYSTAASSA